MGVPIDSIGSPDGGPPFGTEMAPAELRARGIVGRLGAADHGDTAVRVTGSRRDPVSGIVGWPSVGSMIAGVRTAAGQIVSGGERPFLLGGCCALVMGAVAGAKDQLGSVGLVSVDGHLDLYDNQTSPTGEAADMPTAALLGIGWPGLLSELGSGPVLTGSQIALLGARDSDEARDVGDMPERLGITVTGGAACAAAPARAADAIIGAFAAAGLPYWLHLDVDVLSQDVFGATDYLMPDGLDLVQLTGLLSPFGGDDGLIGFSVGCYNPSKDPGGRCGDELADVLVSAFG
ncbi:MAG TPA: arginase family protein [Streptosporangiaceae bacterium]|jgi:arginase|nr:arginase family protein [Streptosporangiaceae bacterium]